MDIGITYSSNPAALITQSGKMLSDNIRDIGRQVQSTILEINTRKDLARFAQNLQQNVNPNSPDFANQAVQVASQHPLALQDPRGQIALNILGKAHSDWQKGQLAVQRQTLYGNAPGIGIFNRSTGKVSVNAPTKPEVFVSTPGGPMNKATGRDPQGNPIKLPDSFVATPGGIMNKRTGTDAQGNPIVIPQKGAMTEYQKLQADRMSRKDKVDLIKSDIAEIDQNYASLKKTYDTLKAREDDLAKQERAAGDDKTAIAQIQESRKKHEEQKTKVGSEADALLKKKESRMKDLQALESEIGSGASSETPESVREAYRSGKITREQAKEALSKLLGQ